MLQESEEAIMTNRVRTVDRALLFCALQAGFADFSVVCYVGLVYSRPRFGLLSSGGAVRDEPVSQQIRSYLDHTGPPPERIR